MAANTYIPAKISFRIGRQRITKGLSPTQAGYVSHIREQARALSDTFAGHFRVLEAASPAMMAVAMEPVMTRSQEYVPYHTGRLYRSAYLEARTGARGPEVIFGYAKNGNPHYAGYVHEGTWMRFSRGVNTKGKGPGFRNEKRGAKFLERAVNELWHVVLFRLKELIEQSKVNDLERTRELLQWRANIEIMYAALRDMFGDRWMDIDIRVSHEEAYEGASNQPTFDIGPVE